MPRIWILPIIASLLLEPAAASADKHLAFLSCPIVRDTKEVPCWIARYNGETYFLGIQQDIGANFYPPQLKHQVLVEGTVTNEPRICGGIVLKPVAVSPLPEIDRRCNTILPGGKYEINFAPRGAGPSTGGTPASGPPRAAVARPAAAPAAVSGPRNFTVHFDFDNSFMTIKNSAQVSAAIQYATAGSEPRTVEVRGFRSATLLSNGKQLVERADMAQLRAEKVSQALRELGIADAQLKTTWASLPEPPNGESDVEARRVEILVTP